MTPLSSPSISTCLPLAEGFALYEGTKEVGRLEPAAPVGPLDSEDLSQLEDSSHSLYYLLPHEKGYCAYPITLDSHQASGLRSPLVSPEMESISGHYGVPTRFSLDRRSLIPQGPLYDPDAQIYYEWDPQSLRIFVVGDRENYSAFWMSIAQYSDFLWELWKEQPLGLLRPNQEPYPEILAPAGNPIPPEAVAPALEAFFQWLQGYDATLAQAVQERVTYTPRYTYQNILEYLACHREEKQELYAYYDPEHDKIFLMPRTLRMILRGDYPAAAGVLHHENTHRIHFQNGLVPPSQTMLYYSVESFLSRVAQNSPLESLLVFLGGDFIRARLHCNASPMIFEEEAAAFSQDILYTYRHPEIEAIFPYRQESQEFLDYTLQSLRTYFPPQIFTLSQQYLEASYHLNP